MTNGIKPVPKNSFELIICSRCSGTGEHSSCLMYGTTCFKCHGSGYVYTMRGLIARDYFKTLFVKGCSQEEKTAAFAKAIEFQSTLTKQGKPLKIVRHVA